MGGKKRKSSANLDNAPSTRRQSGRVTKARVNKESDVQSQDSDFKTDPEPVSDDDVSKTASSPADYQEEEDEDEDDGEADGEYEKGLKKKGWKKKVGKDGKWEMVIEMPGKKDDGGIPYEEGRVHPNTLDFLAELKKNNQREWLKFHDAPYR
jgi:hypothetical protein